LQNNSNKEIQEHKVNDNDVGDEIGNSLVRGSTLLWLSKLLISREFEGLVTLVKDIILPLNPIQNLLPILSSSSSEDNQKG
jgi:hypothetical protein